MIFPGRVVFRVRREHEHDVQPQPDRVPLYLDVALLQDVEQPHLDLPAGRGSSLMAKMPRLARGSSP